MNHMEEEIAHLRVLREQEQAAGYEQRASLEQRLRELESLLAAEGSRREGLEIKVDKAHSEADSVARHGSKEMDTMLRRLNQFSGELDVANRERDTLQLRVGDFDGQKGLLSDKMREAERLFASQLADSQRELNDLRRELQELLRVRARLELELREGRERAVVDLMEMKLRAQKSVLARILLSLKRKSLLYYVCAFYYWSDVTKDIILHRSARELGEITKDVINFNERERSSPSIDSEAYEALDVHAMAAGFGLAS